MEAAKERREFDKVMRKLNDLGNTLKLAFEFGGVDANSLNRLKEIAKWFDEIEKPDEYLDGFINDWLELPEYRPILEKWIKRACALYKYSQMEKYVNFKAEQLGKDYVDIVETYERWRCSIIYWLAENHLRKGEMITLDGTIYLKEQQENKEKGDVVSKGLREVSFEDNLLVEDKGGLLASLHKLIDGRKGKSVAIVIKVCCDYGIMMAKPTYTQVKKEFGDIGVKSGYDAYMVDGKIKEDEKKPVSVALSKYLM